MSVSREKRKPVKPNVIQRVAMSLSRLYMTANIRIQFGFKVKKRLKVGEPFICLSNHTTDNDLFYPIASISDYMYFVCSEHLFRQGYRTRRMVFFSNPIPMFKGSVALTTTMEILKRIREGNSICLFPEGSRTFDGRTGPIAESTGKLVKRAKCGLLTFRQEGGYFTAPRWAKYPRKGPMWGGPVHYYPADEVAKMSVDEINEVIRYDLHYDAYEVQMKNPRKYIGKNKAEGIENFLFICPKCKGFETIRSKGDEFYCTCCNMKGHYDDYGMLSGDLPFKTVPEWEAFEDAEFDRLYDETPDLEFVNEEVSLSYVTDDHQETVLGTYRLTCDKEGFSIGGQRFDFLKMEATEFINLGNTFLFTYEDAKHYTMTSGYLNSVKLRKMYFRCVEKHAADTGRKVDLAK